MAPNILKSILFMVNSNDRNRSCLWVGGCRYVCLCACGWVCYHGNSKSRSSILTKLGL